MERERGAKGFILHGSESIFQPISDIRSDDDIRLFTSIYDCLLQISTIVHNHES